MYKYIYFDLDDTLIQDNEVTNKSEILEEGLNKYRELSKRYPNSKKILFTNRSRDEIKYPSVYTFDKVLGKEDMQEYIEENINRVNLKNLLSVRNMYLYIRGLRLYRNGSTPKLLYLFLKHVIEGDEILVLDDDKRVSGMFGE
jgi:hypothetical protein